MTVLAPWLGLTWNPGTRARDFASCPRPDGRQILSCVIAESRASDFLLGVWIFSLLEICAKGASQIFE